MNAFLYQNIHYLIMSKETDLFMMNNTTAFMKLDITRHIDDHHHSVEVQIPRIFDYKFHSRLRNETECSWCGKTIVPAWIYDMKDYWESPRFCIECYPIVMSNVRSFLCMALEKMMKDNVIDYRPNMILPEDIASF
jgi:hypothetical protein